MNRLEWHGSAAEDHVRNRVIKSLSRAAKLVARRAKELLSVPGTGVTDEPTRKQKAAARARETARNLRQIESYNKRYAKKIASGTVKARRLTSSGGITSRAVKGSYYKKRGGRYWLFRSNE